MYLILYMDNIFIDNNKHQLNNKKQLNNKHLLNNKKNLNYKLKLNKKELNKLLKFKDKKYLKNFLNNFDKNTLMLKIKNYENININDETIINNLRYKKCLEDIYDLREFNITLKKDNILNHLLNNKINFSLFYFGNINNIYNFIKTLFISNNFSNNKILIKFDDLNKNLYQNFISLCLEKNCRYKHFEDKKEIQIENEFKELKNLKFNNLILKNKLTFKKNIIYSSDELKNIIFQNKKNSNGQQNSNRQQNPNGQQRRNGEQNPNSHQNPNGQQNLNGHQGGNSIKFCFNKYSSENTSEIIKLIKKIFEKTIIEVDFNDLNSYNDLFNFILEKQFNYLIENNFKKQYINKIEDLNTPGDLKDYKCYFNIDKNQKINLYDEYNKILKKNFIKKNISFNIKSKLNISNIFKLLNYNSNNKENIISYINSVIKELKHIFKYNYLFNLGFKYETKKYSINPDEIIEKTCIEVNKYFDLFENILISIIEDNEFSKIKNLEKYIEEEFKTKLKNIFICGFITSILYGYDKNSLYNIPKSYLSNNKYYENIDILNDKNIEKGIYYFDNIKKKIVCIEDNLLKEYVDKQSNFKEYNILNDIRPIFTKNQLNIIFKQFNFQTKLLNVLNLNVKKNIEIQKKFLYVFDILKKDYNNQLKIEYELFVDKKIKEYFLNNEINESIIKKSKIKFKKIVENLNKELLNITKSKDINILYEYNLFLEKYVIWIIMIIDKLINFSNNSKQKILFNQIFEMFLSKKNIIQWHEKCKKNKLNYYIPIKTKEKNISTFKSKIGISKQIPGKSEIKYYNLITGKIENKLNKFDYTIIGIRNNNLSTDEFNCWTESTDNIKIDELIIYYMKYLDSYYVKEHIECSLNNITNEILNEKIKILENTNNINNLKKKMEEINSQIIEYESSSNLCKYLISYEQLLKEILKVKYPLKITNKNNVNSSILNSKVREYQYELMKIIS